MAHISGLSSSAAKKNLRIHGLNVLPEQRKSSGVEHFVKQFKSPFIYVLVFSGVVTLFLREYTDSLVISSAVLLNTILGFYQETKAEKAMSALKSMLNPKSTVIRDDQQSEIETKNIVPDDVIILDQGDKVPADARLFESVNFATDESILTGESKLISKKDDDMVYMGTTVIAGRAYATVVQTGAHTKMGKIAKDLVTIKEERTPLQIRINKLAQYLAAIVLSISVVIFLLGIFSGRSFTEMFTTSVAVAVASVPEGMPISMTVILAIGMQKIFKRKALVRKLVAAETLGSVTVIATDKTGTLTEGKMRVSKTHVTNLKEAVYASVVANDLNDPLEIALWEWGYQNGYDPQKIQDSLEREEQVPFTSERKYMSVKVNGTTYYKGAPEVIVEMAKVPDKQKKELFDVVEQWSQMGQRMIALAKSDSKGRFEVYGIVALDDPVRENLKSVFDKTSAAGIRIMMITGDYAGTAESVWRKIKSNANDPMIVDGAELESYSDDKLLKQVKTVDIFARVSPDQKLRIVEALKKNGEVVALVGDGVNDAPALKKADIGIVVGEASDVSKETADMVLLDSNFQTIIAAVEEGRGIFQNMKKVILYLLSDNFTMIILVLCSILTGMPLPMTASQILWINIITDGAPALALTVDPREMGLLKKRPIRQTEALLDIEMKLLIVIISTVTALMSFFTFAYFYAKTDLITAQTMTFTSLGIGTIVYIYSVRSLSKPIWKNSPLNNKYLLVAVVIGTILQVSAVSFGPFRKLLKTTEIDLNLWMFVGVFACGVILLVEMLKLGLRKKLVLSNRKI